MQPMQSKDSDERSLMSMTSQVLRTIAVPPNTPHASFISTTITAPPPYQPPPPPVSNDEHNAVKAEAAAPGTLPPLNTPRNSTLMEALPRTKPKQLQRRRNNTTAGRVERSYPLTAANNSRNNNYVPPQRSVSLNSTASLALLERKQQIQQQERYLQQQREPLSASTEKVTRQAPILASSNSLPEAKPAVFVIPNRTSSQATARSTAPTCHSHSTDVTYEESDVDDTASSISQHQQQQHHHRSSSLRQRATDSLDQLTNAKATQLGVPRRTLHARRSSEQLSTSSLSLHRYSTPPLPQSPSLLMDSVTEAVTSVFYEASMIWDEPVNADTTVTAVDPDSTVSGKEQHPKDGSLLNLKDSWPTPPTHCTPLSQAHTTGQKKQQPPQPDVADKIMRALYETEMSSMSSISTTAPIFPANMPPRIFPPPRVDSASPMPAIDETADATDSATSVLSDRQIGSREKCHEWLQRTKKQPKVAKPKVVEADRRAKVGQSVHLKLRRVRWADSSSPIEEEEEDTDRHGHDGVEWVEESEGEAAVAEAEEGTAGPASGLLPDINPPPRFSNRAEDNEEVEYEEESEDDQSWMPPPRSFSLLESVTAKPLDTIVINHRANGRSSSTSTDTRSQSSSTATSARHAQRSRAHTAVATASTLPALNEDESFTAAVDVPPISSGEDAPLDGRSNVPASSRFATPFFTHLSETSLSLTTTTHMSSSAGTRLSSADDNTSQRSAAAADRLAGDQIEIRLQREITLEEARANYEATLPREKMKLRLKRSARADPVCACCSRVITEPTCIYAMDRYWMVGHFRCARCKFSFANGTFVAHQGRAYCPYDYHAMFGQRCAGCKMTIRDTSIRAMDALWHAECFRCEGCGLPLKDGGYIIIDDAPYCERDAQHIMARR